MLTWENAEVQHIDREHFSAFEFLDSAGASLPLFFGSLFQDGIGIVMFSEEAGEIKVLHGDVSKKDKCKNGNRHTPSKDRGTPCCLQENFSLLHERAMRKHTRQ